MFCKFPSIEQFSAFVKSGRKFYKSYDSDTEEKFTNTPITLQGTVKLHGTNAGIGFSIPHGIWAQSRTRVITPDNDNYGFAFYVHENKERFSDMLKKMAEHFEVDLNTHTIYCFGEFFGDKIQKSMAISGLPKSFAIFDAVAVSLDNTEPRWLDVTVTDFHMHDINCFNMGEFKTFQMTVLLDKVSLPETRKELVRLTQEVERECPAGGYFGRRKEDGDCTTGEGIVWRGFMEKTYVSSEGEQINVRKIIRFKVKGDEHATSKVSSMASLTPEVCSSIGDFVEKSVTNTRCEQGVSEIFGEEEPSTAWFKRTKRFTSWVLTDVKKEDIDSVPSDLKNNKGLTKPLVQAITNKASQWLKQKIEMGW